MRVDTTTAYCYWHGPGHAPPWFGKAARGACLPMVQAGRECQHAGLRRRYPNIELVEVPYEGTTLPALFMKAPGVSGRAPTVVVFDGMLWCEVVASV